MHFKIFILYLTRIIYINKLQSSYLHKVGNGDIFIVEWKCSEEKEEQSSSIVIN